MPPLGELAFTRLPLDRPTLILDPDRARANIARMAAKAARAGVRFRPHFKTHQSAEIGGWFRDHGVEAITVSSLTMAAYFARHGWKDITVAIPVNLREMRAIDELAGMIDLGLLVDAPAAVEALAREMRARARVWVKIDAGYGRAGVPWDRPDEVLALVRGIQLSPRLRFAGLLTHSGHSYRQIGIDGIRQVHFESLGRMEQVRGALVAAGAVGAETESCPISVGDTPTCSTMDEFPGVSEIRPGNFVFYDLMQLRLGTCSAEDIAVSLACPVIGVYPKRREVVIYGGSVHLSSERLLRAGPGQVGTAAGVGGHTRAGDHAGAAAPPGGEARPLFGCLMASGAGGALGVPDERAPVVGLTQEHGVVRLPEGALERVRIGDLVLVCPVHSCLTAALYKEYLTLDGRQVERM